MKQLVILLLAGVVLGCTPAAAQKLEFKEHISKQFELKKPAAQTVVGVYNIDGSIKVESYTGTKVLVEIDKTISGKTQAIVDEGKEEFKLEIEETGDSILVYINAPYYTRPHEERRNNNRERRIEYRSNLNFIIRVPANINLDVSTINNGEVHVKDVSGNIKARNINGGIALENARGTTDVHTINGDVTINYLSSPPEKSSYYTLNGNIRVTYPASFSADLQFKSFNGGFYTDFPDAELLAPEVIKNTEHNGEKTVYKLDKRSSIRIGKGGRLFRFETFNGNIYIKKQS
ncbi:hypothetical protein [Emticicia sp. 21SJ11W-3]|uniref:DUF4097 family beta strand repeat-containing protein n=1 Tax=Emticicia sp. 21SJ11W-3 TaxID=2916755 RepID=UPI00209D3241|nr:hypothetical protein [Emticicia sp. 21SJ11W-3]UTA66365.1 hypothetical protein MB380_12200 [Emticicia sp. 21SJ11W-3]